MGMTAMEASVSNDDFCTGRSRGFAALASSKLLGRAYFGSLTVDSSRDSHVVFGVFMKDHVNDLRIGTDRLDKGLFEVRIAEQKAIPSR